MKKGLKLKNIAFYIISLYPLINISIAYFNNNQGLRSAYIICSMLVLILIGTKKKDNTIKVKWKFLLFFNVAFIGIIFSSINNPSVDAFLFGIVFLIFLLFMRVYADYDLQIDFEKFCINKIKFINIIEILYLIILLLSCIYGNGINAKGWNTISLRGAYEINHLLAYELLVFTGISLYFLHTTKSKYQLINTILLILLVFLTGVRSTILALIVMIYYYLNKLNVNKRALTIVIGVLVVIVLGISTDVFEVVWQKTKTAYEMGSITSSRPAIFKNSLKAILNSDSSIPDYMFGIGLDRLSMYNRRMLFMEVHAHNDFIDALVLYGALGFLLYIYEIRYFFSRIRNRGLFLFYFLLAFFNGFYQYQFVVIGFPFLMIVFDINNNKRRGR